MPCPPPRAAPRHGFGLARARNAGARATLHDILVFLDGDVIAEARLLAARARWHHAVSDALTLGFCSRCDRGQQYCGAHCNGLARRDADISSLDAAGTVMLGSNPAQAAIGKGLLRS